MIHRKKYTKAYLHTQKQNYILKTQTHSQKYIQNQHRHKNFIYKNHPGTESVQKQKQTKNKQ